MPGPAVAGPAVAARVVAGPAVAAGAGEVEAPGTVRYRRAPSKLAGQLAGRIQRGILEAGWPVGANLGSEPDLVAAHGVSRSILREAVRITEFLGLAEMRRGPGGGLIVTRPDPSAVLAGVMIYLTFRKVRLEEVMQARHPVEELAVRLASARCTPSEVNTLWGRLCLELTEARPDHWVLHDLLASTSGNPAVELFTEILSRVTGQYRVTDRRDAARRRERLQESALAHRALVEAVATGQSDLAAHRIHQHLDAIESSLLHGGAAADRSLSAAVPVAAGGDKRSAVVARRIFVDITSMGWPVGAVLGSEAELQARYDVSRAALREALRLLEFHSVVRTKRGPGGGILVARPDEDATTEALAVYLEFRGITLDQLIEVREAVELAVVDLAVASFGPDAIQALWDTLAEDEASPPEALGTSAHRLHVRMAELTGNGALTLFVHALTRLTEHHEVEADAWVSDAVAAASVGRAHRAIVRAIAAGDAPKARRRLQLHLRSLPALLK